MNLAIPPDFLVQAGIAFLAGVIAFALGAWLMHRAWSHHDTRAERDFIIGVCVAIIGISWTIIASAIILGELGDGNDAVEAAVQEMVVFTNAATRIAVLILGTHTLWDVWRKRK
jgi:heme A synthase